MTGSKSNCRSNTYFVLLTQSLTVVIIKIHMNAKDLKQIEELLDKKGLATKEDIKNFATKEDLKSFATKEDLKSFATKEDIKNFATKDDLKNLATKDDLEGVKAYLENEIGEMGRLIIETVNNTMVSKKAFNEFKKSLGN